MKIAVNTGNYEILNSLIRVAKEQKNTIAIAKYEKTLFDNIDNDDIDAFVITSGSDYCQKAIDFIKKCYRYTPVILIEKTDNYEMKNADIVFPFNKEIDTDIYAKSILYSINMYIKNFKSLKRLSANTGKEIDFGKYKYDTVKRIIYFGENNIQKLSPKQAGIFEILASNFGVVIKRDVVLEKVWHESNYFVGRSLDVFTTHLRKILKKADSKMTITNVSNVGLLLDYESNILNK